MAQRTPPSEVTRGSVSVDIDGATHTGSYALKDGWVTVFSAYGSMPAELHQAPPARQLPPEQLARLLLGEIVREAKRRGELEP
jgi:hypothetical protein